MRIEVDQAKCCGFGACIIAAPDLFDLSEETNLAFSLVEVVPDAARSQLEAAIAECPTAAITARAVDPSPSA